MSTSSPTRPTMLAVRQEGYGPPGILRVAEVDRPVPEDDEVLVRIRAAVVTPSDGAVRSGTPWIARLVTGLRPRIIPGDILAGHVVQVGANVDDVRRG